MDKESLHDSTSSPSGGEPASAASAVERCASAAVLRSRMTGTGLVFAVYLFLALLIAMSCSNAERRSSYVADAFAKWLVAAAMLTLTGAAAGNTLTIGCRDAGRRRSASLVFAGGFTLAGYVQLTVLNMPGYALDGVYLSLGYGAASAIGMLSLRPRAAPIAGAATTALVLLTFATLMGLDRLEQTPYLPRPLAAPAFILTYLGAFVMVGVLLALIAGVSDVAKNSCGHSVRAGRAKEGA